MTYVPTPDELLTRIDALRPLVRASQLASPDLYGRVHLAWPHDDTNSPYLGTDTLFLESQQNVIRDVDAGLRAGLWILLQWLETCLTCTTPVAWWLSGLAAGAVRALPSAGADDVLNDLDIDDASVRCKIAFLPANYTPDRRPTCRVGLRHEVPGYPQTRVFVQTRSPRSVDYAFVGMLRHSATDLRYTRALLAHFHDAGWLKKLDAATWVGLPPELQAEAALLLLTEPSP